GRLDALPMTGDARQAAAGRPASIAVHDDGDVLGNGLGPDCLEQRRLAVSRGHAMVISRSARMTKSPAHGCSGGYLGIGTGEFFHSVGRGGLLSYRGLHAPLGSR